MLIFTFTFFPERMFKLQKDNHRELQNNDMNSLSAITHRKFFKANNIWNISNFGKPTPKTPRRNYGSSFFIYCCCREIFVCHLNQIMLKIINQIDTTGSIYERRKYTPKLIISKLTGAARHHTPQLLRSRGGTTVKFVW